MVGEGASVPMRIHLDTLASGHRPRSDSARFSKAWVKENVGSEFITDTIHKWRNQVR